MRTLILLTFLAGAASAQAAVVSFQVGAGGYTTGRDTDIHQAEPDFVFGPAVSASVDASDGGGQTQALLAFDGIVGNAATQIPAGAIVTSATLKLQIDSAGSGINMHRMVSDWNEATITWNTAGNGISANDVEARAAASLSIGANDANTNIPAGALTLDVTADVQAWVNGTPNFGWAILPFVPNGTNGVDFLTREDAVIETRPLLTVGFVVPEPTSLMVLAGLGGLLGMRRGLV
jgi:hypothetical protein